MKKSLIFLSMQFIACLLHSQDPIEHAKQTITPAGSLEQISVSVKPFKVSPKSADFDSLNMSFTGNWGFGQSFSVACSPSGDTVFVGAGAGILIFDATDPYNPVLISEIRSRALVDGCSYDPFSKRLYVAAYFSGLEIWDLTDLNNPQLLGRAPTTGLARGGIHFKDDLPTMDKFAYLVNVGEGVDIFSVTDPSDPVLLDTYHITGSQYVWNSFKQGDTLYLASGAGGTRAVDLTGTPVLTNPFNISTVSTSLNVLGTEAFIVNSAYGLKIYDISVLPPTMVGQIAQSGFPYTISVFNDHAFIANSTTNPGGGLNIFDVSNTSSPQHIVDYPGFQTYIAGKNNKVYCTGGSAGCIFFDMAEPLDPVAATTYPLPYSAWDIAVSGNYAYLGSNGFRVFDISDKNHPVQAGYNDIQGDLVEVTGDIAVYCPKSMGANNYVTFLNISDPQNPEFLGHYLAPVMTYDIDLKGHYAFIGCWWDGFRVIDFSNPANPVLAAHEMGWVNGGIPGEEWCYVQALDIEGDFLYLLDYGPFETDDTKGVYSFDISDPENPVFISRFENYTGTGCDIKVSGGYAYLADNAAGFNVIDVGDPANMSEVVHIPLGDAANAVDVFGDYAFIANYILEGVQVLNISNPATPFIEGYYKPSGCFAVNVTYNSGHVYVADGPAGFGIYKFDLLSGDEENAVMNGFDVEIIPNPARDYIVVCFNPGLAGILKGELISLQGQTIRTFGATAILPGRVSETYDIAGIPHGTYLLRLTVNSRPFVQKIILY